MIVKKEKSTEKASVEYINKPLDKPPLKFPTDPFTILEPCDQEISSFYVDQKRRATDFEAPKLWKGRSG